MFQVSWFSFAELAALGSGFKFHGILRLLNQLSICLDGQSFNLKTESFLFQEKARFIVREMTKERAEGKRLGTPMVFVESDFTTLEIKITTGF